MWQSLNFTHQQLDIEGLFIQNMGREFIVSGRCVALGSCPKINSLHRLIRNYIHYRYLIKIVLIFR